MSPLVSVVLPVYQGAESVLEAVESALCQTHADLEIVIVDDGSTDGTPDLLEERVADARVRVVRQEHAGACAARNRGAAVARGEMLLFHEADVVLRPECVEEMLAALDAAPDAAFAYCDFEMRGWREGVHKARPFDPVALRRGNYVSAVSLLRAEAFPGWDPLIRGLQDWDMWLTILDRGGSGVYVPRTLFLAYQRTDSITGSWVRNNWSEATAAVLAKHVPVAHVIVTAEDGAAKREPSSDAPDRLLLDRYVLAPSAGTVTPEGEPSAPASGPPRAWGEALLEALGSRYAYVVLSDTGLDDRDPATLYPLVKAALLANGRFAVAEPGAGRGEPYARCRLGDVELRLFDELGAGRVVIPVESSSALEGIAGEPQDIPGTISRALSRRLMLAESAEDGRRA